MTQLVRYEAARAALAEARSVDEVKTIRDQAEAIRIYARMANDVQMEIDAAEIRLRAERRLGIILADQKRTAGLNKGGRPAEKTGSDEEPVSPPTLAEMGIDKKLSMRAQKAGGIAEQAFEAMIDGMRQRMSEGRVRVSLDLLKNPPVNGARAIMGSRVEPDDSLDYFPTPPWATRALIERVLPRSGLQASLHAQSAWEPACGEGHIAEVLREYFGGVFATDIHDYGFGAICDFIDPAPDADGPHEADWIITNPPFGDKAEEFILRALSCAKVGVAMFLRLQWLESVGRYERIFSKHPPYMIAQFAERVPLHKGRWEPDGTTATAYLWIVWLKKRSDRSTGFMWIPPGQREALTRPDDRERFTAQPVIKKQHIVVDEPFDVTTGEILESNSAHGDLPDSADEGARAAEHSPPKACAPSPPIASRDGSDLDIPAFLKRGDDNSIPAGGT